MLLLFLILSAPAPGVVAAQVAMLPDEPGPVRPIPDEPKRLDPPIAAVPTEELVYELGRRDVLIREEEFTMPAPPKGSRIEKAAHARMYKDWRKPAGVPQAHRRPHHKARRTRVRFH